MFTPHPRDPKTCFHPSLSPTEKIEVEVGPDVTVLIFRFALVHGVVAGALMAFLDVVERELVVLDMPVAAVRLGRGHL